MTASRVLPPELAAALRRARDAEAVARPLDQRIRAMRATSRPMRSLFDDGWPIAEIAMAMHIDRQTAGKRVLRARRLDQHGLG